MILPVDRKLLIGWKDNVSYGVDVVNPAGNPFTNGTIELHTKDFGALWKEKGSNIIRADFLPLLTGESIALKYKEDRSANWTSVTANTVGDTSLRLPLGGADSRHREMKIAVDLAASGTTSPTLLEAVLDDDFLTSEEDI